MRVILAAIFIALLTFSGNALADCFPPKEMHKALNQSGLFLYSYGMTDQRFLISVWIGKGHFIVLVEDDKSACIAAHGVEYYLVSGGDI